MSSRSMKWLCRCVFAFLALNTSIPRFDLCLPDHCVGQVLELTGEATRRETQRVSRTRQEGDFQVVLWIQSGN